jgi:ADP-ribose pyrophosphatase
MPQKLAPGKEVEQMRELGKEVFARVSREGLPKIRTNVFDERKVGRLLIQDVSAVVDRQSVTWTKLSGAINPVNVLPVLKTGDEEHYILTFKPQLAIGSWTFELVGGAGKKGEEPIDVARRELLEETGFEAGRLSIISPIIANFPQRIGWTDTTFLAEDLTFRGRTSTEVEESLLKIIALTPKEVMMILRDHRVLTALSRATLYEHMVAKYLSKTDAYQSLLR